MRIESLRYGDVRGHQSWYRKIRYGDVHGRENWYWYIGQGHIHGAPNWQLHRNGHWKLCPVSAPKHTTTFTLGTCSRSTLFNRVILNSMGLYVGSASPMTFHWLLCIQNQKLLSTCGACSKVVFEFECRATYSGSLGVKLTVPPHACQNEFDPRLVTIECSLFKTSTLPPSMHW